MGKQAKSLLFLGELNKLESIIVRDMKRAKVRDAIRRYGDRKFGTKQVGDDVIVTRIE